MPKMVERLTPAERAVADEVNRKFTVDQQCAYYLTKTVRSIYQMDDAAVEAWRRELADAADPELEPRAALVVAYTRMLLVEQNCQFHLEYWLRHFQERLIDEIDAFLSGLPPHLANEWDTPEGKQEDHRYKPASRP
jgi:hypothetical protein